MIGRKMGSYEIVAKLGEGGMGEVWRARDARLNRDVAVKILPADVAGDPSRRLRFEQEARALGALNHPNIVAVFDVGQSDGQSYLVSELVEGEPLRAVINRGPLPLRKLLDVATQTAEALAAAHAVGIVHRDLKPENIMVTGSGSGSSGRVKVLDFGLAKQTAPQKREDQTATLLLSQPGTVLGTAGYMSPEQVRGESVDARSDIFSFGCVLYEMATAKRAFDGKTAADVISAILKEEPPEIGGTPAPVPPALDAIVRRCLEKDPAQRFQSAADLAFALRSVTAVSTAQHVSAVRRTRRWLIPAIASVAALALVGLGFLLSSRLSTTSVPEFRRVTFREGRVFSARFSPDWKDVVYTAAWDEDPPGIYLSHPGNPESRDLDIKGKLLAISSKGDLAFLVGPFTPDGFGTLARNSISGGQTRELLENVREADWSPDGMELAVVRAAEGKYRLEYPVGKMLAEFPFAPLAIRVSPDGSQVAFTNYASGTRIGLFVVDRSGKIHDLGAISGQFPDLGPMLCWSPDGREIWFRSYDTNDWNTIYAVNLAGVRRVVSRFPGRVALHDIAADGRLLLSTEGGRKGIRGWAPGESMERDLSCLDASELRSLSADGRLIVANVRGESGGEKGSIYIRRTDGTPPVRISDGVAWTASPDGKWVAGYSSIQAAHRKFELIPTGPGEAIPASMVVGWVAGDDHYLVMTPSSGHKIRYSLWSSRTGESKPVTPDGMPDTDVLPVISPDGRRFVAIGPDDEPHIYSIDGAAPLSVSGLTHHDRVVGWRADGRALYITTHRNQNRTIPVSILNLDTGQRAPWKEIRPMIPVDEAGNLHITPDGSAYAYDFTSTRSELFVAEGIR